MVLVRQSIDKTCSPLSHVTELTSNIVGKTISFKMMEHGRPVNTGKFKIEDLHQGEGPTKIVNVNVHHAEAIIRSKPELKIGVLVSGHLKMILDPVYLSSCGRITFNSRLDGRKSIIFATGVDTKEKDTFLRVRFRKQKRREVYAKREKIPELVRLLVEGVLEEEEESGQISDAPYGLAQMIDDGLPSHGRATHNTAALSLVYEDPSFVEGTGEVAVIPDSATNKKMVDMMKHALVGFLCKNEIPKCAPICDYLSKTLIEFRDCKVLLHDDEFFTFVFSSEEDRSKVLEHGQLFINNKPLILRKWTKHLTHEPYRFLYSLPLWVRIYKLNFAYWSRESLYIISREIGSLLFLDKVTTSIIKNPESMFNGASTSTQCIDFCRVCIEINPLDILPDFVSVPIDGESISVRVVYEWKPQLCMHCCSLHHDTTSSNRD